MVRAGETGGSLHDTLARLGDYLERSRALKSSVINAMIYPAFLVGMVLFSLMILLVYVVPQFAPMFADMNVEMPLITQDRAGGGLDAAEFLVADHRAHRARRRLVPARSDGRSGSAPAHRRALAEDARHRRRRRARSKPRASRARSARC